MLLHLRYFALLREERGLEEETIDVQDTTPASLYETLRARHGFSLPRARMMVVVNDAYTGWEHSFQEGDTVVFIPPVAGG